MMHCVITLPFEVWSVISLFLIPIEGMQLLRMAHQFRFLRLERPILNNFTFHFAKFLQDFIKNQDELLDFVRSMGYMGNRRVVFSGSHVLQRLRHECCDTGIGFNFFCDLQTTSIVVRRLLYTQGMYLFFMKIRKEMAEQGHFNLINNIDSLRNFRMHCSRSTVHLFVTRDDVPLRNVVLGFYLNVVQNYYDGSTLFWAFRDAVFTKRMRRVDGTTVGWKRISRFLARGYTFHLSHVIHHTFDHMPIGDA